MPGIEQSGSVGGDSVLSNQVWADFNIDATTLPDGVVTQDPRSGYQVKSSGTGGALLQPSGGYFVNTVANQAAYNFVSLRRRPKRLAMTFKFVAGGGTDAAEPTVALVTMKRDQDTSVRDLAHLIVTKTGWAIQKYVNNVFTNIVNGSFDTPLALDTEYSWYVDMDFNSGTVYLTDPYGDVHSSTDPDLLTNWGRHFFFEIVEATDSPKGKIKTVSVKEEHILATSDIAKPSDFWLPTSDADGTVALAENIQGGRYSNGAFADIAVLTSGVMYLAGGMVLPAKSPVWHLTFLSGTTAANTPTNQWAALLDRQGRVLAVTADQTNTAWAADTVRRFTFASAFIPEGPTPVFVGLMVKATTPPSLAGISLGAKYTHVLNDKNQIAGNAAATGLSTPIAVDTTRRPINTPTTNLAYVIAE